MGDEPPPPEVVPPLPDDALEERVRLFDTIFADCKADFAKKASLDERQANEELAEKQSLTYGEIGMMNLNSILNGIKKDPLIGPLYANQGIFLDIGSGAGKACIGAALLHPFQKVVGIETMGSLDGLAQAALGKYKEDPMEGIGKPEVELIKGDFMEMMADKIDPIAPEVAVCLLVATCYSAEQMQALGAVANKMPTGAIVVSVTQPLPESMWYTNTAETGGWNLQQRSVMEFLWGQSTLFVFKKMAPPVVLEMEAAEGAAEE